MEKKKVTKLPIEQFMEYCKFDDESKLHKEACKIYSLYEIDTAIKKALQTLTAEAGEELYLDNKGRTRISSDEMKELFIKAQKINEETKEVENLEELNVLKILFENLEGTEEQKLQNVVYYYRNLQASVQAIKAEEERLKERRKIYEKKVDKIFDFIYNYLNGEKIKTPLFEISFRKSTVLDVEDEIKFINHCRAEKLGKYLKEKITIDAMEVKKALKDGVKLPHASLKTKNNMSIK